MPWGDWRSRRTVLPRPPAGWPRAGGACWARAQTQRFAAAYRRLAVALGDVPRMNTFDDDNEPALRRSRRAAAPARAAASAPRRTAAVRLARRPPPCRSRRPRDRDRLRLVLWIGSCSSSSKQSYTSYIDAMRPPAKSSASVGKEFATALGTPGLTMASFQADLARWSQQEQAQLRGGAAAPAARPAPERACPGACGLPTALRRPPAPREHAHGRAAEARPQRDRRGRARERHAELLSASDVVWEQLFRLPATGHPHGPRRHRRDRPRVADRDEPRHRERCPARDLLPAARHVRRAATDA